MLFQFIVCWLCTTLVGAVQQPQSGLYPADPYLEWRPAFVRSLPIQILLTGVVFTLVSVLFIHLIFTAQYHWPLAPVNYVLQLSGVATLLISLIATLHVVLSAALEESKKWPYMLSYIAVTVPPFVDPDINVKNWTLAEQATWLVMNASTSALIQITHIQFLTLLYPSRLEGRLIFTLLGPLAIVAAVMQLIPISSSEAINSAASAIRNVCNATLSLLFTAALFIWGFLVNRKQAWRTDGGTAAFGCAALTLAVASTALNILYVHREEEYVWLPSLMWAVILWQSFLGWWWWVGAGSGSGLSDEEAGQKQERKARRETRRKEARERRNQTKKRAKNAWRGVTGAFHREDGPHDSTVVASSNIDSDVGSPVGRRTSRSPGNAIRSRRAGQETSPSQASSVGSNSSSSTFHTLPRLLPAVIHRWYASLRHAHAVAARQQAVERVERIRELDRHGALSTPQHGWGLGSFGWRINRDQQSRTRPPPETDGEGGESDYELTDRHERVSRWQHETSSGREDDHQSEKEVPRTPSIPPPAENSSPGEVAANTGPPVTPPDAGRSRSMFWWGPLAHWRLKDSTNYG